MDTQVVDFGFSEDVEQESVTRLLKAELKVRLPQMEAVHYPIYSGDNSVGRQETNDICIQNATVSSNHLLITVKENDTCFITDLKSTNGTRIFRCFATSPNPRGTALEPNIRVRIICNTTNTHYYKYQLTNGNSLLVGKVRCDFLYLQDPTGTSDHGSNSELIDLASESGEEPELSIETLASCTTVSKTPNQHNNIPIQPEDTIDTNRDQTEDKEEKTETGFQFEDEDDAGETQSYFTVKKEENTDKEMSGTEEKESGGEVEDMELSDNNAGETKASTACKPTQNQSKDTGTVMEDDNGETQAFLGLAKPPNSFDSSNDNEEQERETQAFGGILHKNNNPTEHTRELPEGLQFETQSKHSSQDCSDKESSHDGEISSPPSNNERKEEVGRQESSEEEMDEIASEAIESELDDAMDDDSPSFDTPSRQIVKRGTPEQEPLSPEMHRVLSPSPSSTPSRSRIIKSDAPISPSLSFSGLQSEWKERKKELNTSAEPSESESLVLDSSWMKKRSDKLPKEISPAMSEELPQPIPIKRDTPKTGLRKRKLYKESDLREESPSSPTFDSSPWMSKKSASLASVDSLDSICASSDEVVVRERFPSGSTVSSASSSLGESATSALPAPPTSPSQSSVDSFSWFLSDKKGKEEGKELKEGESEDAQVDAEADALAKKKEEVEATATLKEIKRKEVEAARNGEETRAKEAEEAKQKLEEEEEAAARKEVEASRIKKIEAARKEEEAARRIKEIEAARKEEEATRREEEEEEKARKEQEASAAQKEEEEEEKARKEQDVEVKREAEAKRKIEAEANAKMEDEKEEDRMKGEEEDRKKKEEESEETIDSNDTLEDNPFKRSESIEATLPDTVEDNPFKRSESIEATLPDPLVSVEEENFQRKQEKIRIISTPPRMLTRRRSQEISEEQSGQEQEEEDEEMKEVLPAKTGKRKKRSSPTKATLPKPKRKKVRREAVAYGAEEESVAVIVPVVMFTGITNPAKYEKQVIKLGGSIADCIEECTHLITDKVRRTVKFLSAIGLDKKIVSISWITSSIKAKAWLNGDDYIISDPVAEQKFKFTLRSSLLIARGAVLLDGYSFYTTPGVKPPRGELKQIIISAGGKPLTKIPKAFDDHLIIISCTADKKKCDKFVSLGFNVYEVELLLGGILRQELELSDHILIKKT